MASYWVTGSETVTGGSDTDTYTCDPTLPVDATIVDTGGKNDRLVFYHSGYFSGPATDNFAITGTNLVWHSAWGSTIAIALNDDGTSPIESISWSYKVPFSSGRTVELIVVAGQPITQINVIVAGTDQGDLIIAPHFSADQATADGYGTMYGGDGNDTLVGPDNAAFGLFGGSGDDVLTSYGNHYAQMGGGSGNDLMTGQRGHDFLFGDDGNDQVAGQAGDDDLYGDAGDDVISGGSGDDQIHGGSGTDRLFGGAGNDVLLAGVGDDSLSGGDGNDKLVGGAGDAFFHGGAGNDTFRFYNMDGHTETIVDFEVANDQLEIVTHAFVRNFGAKVHAVQIGDDVDIIVGNFGDILIRNVLLAELHFDFVT